MLNLGRRVRILLAVTLLFALSASVWWWYKNRPPDVPSAAGLGTQSIVLPKIPTRQPTIPASIQGLLRELNLHQSAGITPDQNAAVLLVQAFGLHPADSDVERDYLELLGIDGPIEDLGHQLWPSSFLSAGHPETATGTVSDPKRLLERCEQSGVAPWREFEYEEVAAWLVANQQSLAAVAAAVKRPSYYQPMVTPRGEAGLLNVLLILDERARIAARLLASRAMLRLAYGRVDAAWDDVLTCFRLGRLVGQGPHAMSQLVALEIEHRAFRAAQAVLREGKSSESTLRHLISALDELPAVQPSAEVMDDGERLLLRDSIERMGEADQPLAPIANLVAELSGRDLVHWDRAWDSASAEVDKVVIALKLESYPERKRRLAELSQEFGQFKDRLEAERNQIVAEWLRGDSSSADRWIGQTCALLLMPNFEMLERNASRRSVELALVKVALALEACYAEEGTYPATLDALSPKYILKVPLDLYTGNAFQYDPQSFEEATSPRYQLYSLFEDQEDDGGTIDRSHPEQGDLVIDLRRRF